MRALVLGGTGMLGHVVRRYFEESGVGVVAPGRREIDFNGLFFFSTLAALIEKVKPDCVINCAGIVKQGIEEFPASEVVNVNALCPHVIGELCRAKAIRFMHVSTDCVFSGRLGSYSELSTPDPVDLYGRSKLLGEQPGPHLTIRTAIIGPEIGPKKRGLMEWFLAQEGAVNGFTNAIWSGVTTLQLAKILLAFAKSSGGGIVHVTTEPASKYHLLLQMQEVFQKKIEIRQHELDRRLDRSLTNHRVKMEIPPMCDQLVELRDWYK